MAMLKIDRNLLVEVGLGNLPDTEKDSFLRHIYETLEMRVGIRLADQMSNDQLDEFERYFEAKDDAGAFRWLETNFPNYKDIVQQEFDKLKSEITQSAPQILAATSQPPAQPVATQPVATQPAVPDAQSVPPNPAPTQPVEQPPAAQPWSTQATPVPPQPPPQPPTYPPAP